VAARELGDPSFGLRFGRSLTLRDLDLLGYICLNSATFGDLLHNIQRYARVFSDGTRPSLVRDGDTVALVQNILDPKVLGLTQWVELTQSFNAHIRAALIGSDSTAVAVELVHARVGPESEYLKALGAPVRFEAGRTATIMPADVMTAAIDTADDRLLAILKQHAEEVLERQTFGGDIRHAVQRLIAPRLQSGEPTIDSVARDLGMSSRTLARRLSEHGVTYRDLLTDLRRELAVRYLSDRCHSSAQIAYLLGFTDASTFSHAFKRWTGRPPSRYLES